MGIPGKNCRESSQGTGNEKKKIPGFRKIGEFPGKLREPVPGEYVTKVKRRKRKRRQQNNDDDMKVEGNGNSDGYGDNKKL